ncbi:MAG TPA: helix-turn-helix domain-containing protein [Gemmatimonadales bacterium]|jgi:AcrR family transcriptional regulator
MATRESVLDVTARLYAEHGWRGTTTRRIATEAGINEVTLFRQFGSKELLLNEAIGVAVTQTAPELPDPPRHLRTELTRWCLANHALIKARSGIIRASLAEWAERPALAPQACSGGAVAFGAVHQYLTQARLAGLISADGSLEAASRMLINTVFMDAMMREAIPASYPDPLELTVARTVDLILRGLGAREAA